LGQHFLIDEEVLTSIIDAAKIQRTDEIIEIGAGIGVLTRELIAQSDHVTTIELDGRMIPLLNAYLRRDGSKSVMPTIVQGHALDYPFPSVPYKIVANIPYHITSPLLRHAFLEGTCAPTSLTLLIQREVAEKICDAHDASLLTIIVGMFGTPHIVRHVPPACFLPPPKVQSSVLHIECFQTPLTDATTMDRVFLLAKHAFSQKRKMLRNTLSNLPGGDAMMESAGIDPQRRPQTLTMQEWIALAQIPHA
jgi:16S rRNA (adenine1518-N6/adenine1519-N6)-dimethyltransferase